MFTLAAKISNKKVASPRQFLRLPPRLAGAGKEQQQLPFTAVVAIDIQSEGVLLVRYTDRHEFAGDTWHPTIEEAKQQAAIEFSAGLGRWIAVPDGTTDIIAFMRNMKR